MPKSKKKYALITVIIVLVIAVAVLAILNAQQTQAVMDGLGKSEVSIVVNGEEAGRFTLEYLKNMPKTDFTDQIKESGSTAVKTEFGGVLLKDVLNSLEIDVSGCSSVSYRASDGYASGGTVDEVLNDDTVYVVYERNGQQTKPKSEGGTGPVEIVIAEQAFSQRNCKFLIQIEFS